MWCVVEELLNVLRQRFLRIDMNATNIYDSRYIRFNRCHRDVGIL